LAFYELPHIPSAFCTALPLPFCKTCDIWPWCFRAGAGLDFLRSCRRWAASPALASNDDIASVLATVDTVFANSVSVFVSSPEPLPSLSESLLSLLDSGLVVAVLVNRRPAF
jgi:hypothetical protein